ncbi:non-specific lipid-transfer protein 1-like [Gastrolobium bilobum]|uniref:non-specific lipid-transfer protein 1-like n=1 Tax=Gastrolobium bilobum TaxID=150636 RepID=UPI002AB11257|nr:non-specific lipid-transfer protein 1-like [Gastrolobium bilobum]
MASSVFIKATCMALIICMALSAPLLTNATLTCCDVKPLMEACDCYVRNGGDRVPEKCCYAAMTLNNEAVQSRQDRQMACRCIKEAAQKIPNLNVTALASVPEKCGIRTSLEVNHTVDCERFSCDDGEVTNSIFTVITL